MQYLRLIEQLVATLALEDPTEALAAAIQHLGEAGLSLGEPTDDRAAWLALTHGGRTLALHGLVPPDETIRPILAGLLRGTLVRLAEHDEYRRARERMEMLSTASFEGILVHVDGVTVDANDRLAEMLGYERQELIGMPVVEVCVAPEERPAVLHRVKERLEGVYVSTGVRKDGSRFRAELASKQGQLGDRPVRIAAVRDVTERERTLAQLLESETRLRELVERTFDFFVFSRDGTVVEVGGRIVETLGYPLPHFAGKHLLDYVAPDVRAFSVQVIGERRIGSFESVFVAADGERVPVEIVGVYTTLGGQPVRLGAVRDLRIVKRREQERRRLEQRVERAQRIESLGVLAGGIAHDFNNLLVGVLGNASVMLAHATDASAREAAEAIIAAGRQAASLTAQMLAYAGQEDLARREPVELGALLEELRTLLAAAMSKKAQLELDIGARSVVLGDRTTLTQVLMNLLTNASDALAAQPGRIVVTTRRIDALDARWDDALGATRTASAWVLVEVRDTGVGMAAATRERVFEPFFSTKKHGHGLGLAACLGIVKSHGGAILVESELGKGTCFSIVLPASELVGQPDHAVAPVAHAARKVLVVDDEELVRSLIRRALEPLGHVVADAANGLAALAMFERVAADVILVDLTMPDIDGIEVVKRIRATGSRVPIVLTSGYLNVLADRPADRGLIDHFLPKPFSVSELLAALELAIARAG